MRIAIVGGTGLVGRHLVAELLARGHEPVPIARHAGPHRGREVRVADVGSAPALEAALDGCEAAVSAFGSLRQPPGATYHDVHVKGVQNLVAACRARRIRRVVHLSALGARAGSRSPYHRAKHSGEELLRRSLLDATVLRPSSIWGPADDFVVPLSRLLGRLPLAPMPGRGAARLQPIAAADVARAIANALERPATIGLAWDLPGPEILRLDQIYDRVMDAAGLRRPKLPIPYLVIEALTHVFPIVPGFHFSFDQLAVLEEERPGDPEPAARDLSLSLSPFSPLAIRRALWPDPAPAPAEQPPLAHHA